MTVRHIYDGPSCRSVTKSRELNSVMKLVTVRRIYGGPCCNSVVEFRESLTVPRFSELKCFGTETLDRPSCLRRFVLPAVKGNEESNKRNYTSMGWRSPSRSVMTMTVRRVLRRPSQFLSKIVLLLEPTKQVVTKSQIIPLEIRNSTPLFRNSPLNTYVCSG